jgi:hypothetical protein
VVYARSNITKRNKILTSVKPNTVPLFCATEDWLYWITPIHIFFDVGTDLSSETTKFFHSSPDAISSPIIFNVRSNLEVTAEPKAMNVK